MPRIMIKCPTTGKLIPTGMAADQNSFDSSTFTNNSVQCPECGRMHTWSKQDAQLEQS
jgi:hypothetical protein